MTCGFAHLDAVYVLGALAPNERLEFARHLAGCAECSRSVRELAGLPGLLARVDLDELEPADGPPLPSTLLPSLVREVGRAQRRRSVLVGAVAATVAAVVATALAVWAGVEADREPGSPASPAAAATRTPGLPMVPVAPTAVRADVLVTNVAWGTRLDVTCSYAAEDEDYEASGGAEYALVVRTRDGRAEQVATWRGLPGRTMRLSAATATSRSEIETVEMRTADGVVLLRLSV